MVLVLVQLAALSILATALVWKGSLWLEGASAKLADYYGVPRVVKGAVILAAGTSAPELASVVIATVRYGTFDLGVGAIVGSAIFNILVIPAVAGISITGPVESTRNVVFKEAQFYLLSVSVIFITFALAMIYNPGDGGQFGEITRPIALIPILLYLLYIFIQWQDTADHGADPPSTSHPLVQWGYLVLALALIIAAVEGLVYAAVGFGDYFGTPSFLWGLTVIAFATSLPDLIVSVRAVQDGEDTTSLANVLGSNTFDLTVAIPVGVLIAGATTVNFAASVPMFAYLTFATILLFAFLRTDLELTQSESYGLLLAYAAFVLWMVLEVVDVTGFVPGV